MAKTHGRARRWIVGAVAFLAPVALGAATLVWAASTRQPPQTLAATERAAVVRVVTVAPGPFVPRVSGFGIVEPARTWAASTQIAGRVAWLSPDFVRGGWLAEGAPLARIADDDYRIALAQALAQVAALDARLAELALVVGNAGESLAIEELALALTETELGRQEALVARGAAPAATLEVQRRQTLTQRARVQDLRNQIALHPDQRRALEQERLAADAAAERARLDLGRAEIRAPFAARVAATDVEVGQFVPAGGALGVLQGVEAAEIDAQMPQGALRAFVRAVFGATTSPTEGPIDAALRDRLSAEIRLRVGEETVVWPAEVSRASPVLDADTRAFGVILRVADPFRADPRVGRPPLSRGLFVEAVIAGAVIPDAVAVPRAALRGGAVLVADAQDRLRRVPVAVAMTVGDAVLLSGGLAPGARVVLTDLPAPVEGMLLRPVEDAAAAARLAAEAGRGAR